MKKRPGSLVPSLLAGGLILNSALAQQTQDYEPIVKVAPVYPETALTDSLEGHVVVEYTITEDGNVVCARCACKSPVQAACGSLRPLRENEVDPKDFLKNEAHGDKEYDSSRETYRIADAGGYE